MHIENDLRIARERYFAAARAQEAAWHAAVDAPRSRAKRAKATAAYAQREALGRELVLVAILAGVVAPEVVESIHYPSEMTTVLYELTR